MIEALKMSMHNRKLQFTLALYSTPTARMRVNGHPSGTFSVERYMPGVPLLIFLPTLEPLLKTKSHHIKGVQLIDHHYKLAAYAGDILMLLTDPITSIPNLLKDFLLFTPSTSKLISQNPRHLTYPSFNPL